MQKRKKKKRGNRERAAILIIKYDYFLIPFEFFYGKIIVIFLHLELVILQRCTIFVRNILKMILDTRFPL